MNAEAATDGRRLPWERTLADPPQGVGICLSGGGLRAASFALGVLQVVQQERGLLFGRNAATHLAVVSGGSYLGATVVLNAAVLAKDGAAAAVPPVAVDSPESQYMVAHGRYLVEDGRLRMGVRFAVPGTMNILSLLVLFLWTGTMLADVAVLASLYAPAWIHPPSDSYAWLQWPLAGSAVFAGGILLRGLYKDGGIARWGLPLGGAAILFATAASLMRRMQALDPLSSPRWWWGLGLWWCAITLAIAIVLGLSVVLGRRASTSAGAWLVGRVAVGIPRALGFVLLSLAATAMYATLTKGLAAGASSHQVAVALAAFFGILIAALAASWIAGRTSLHGVYRDLLSRCFAVRRTDVGLVVLEPSTAAALSDLAPPNYGSPSSFPRLLISATANVRWRDDRRRHLTFAPFVFSHDACGIPGLPGASFETRKLELGQVPAGFFRRKGPLVSLMDAVATTGAAISPSMGRMTLPGLRPFLAVLNVRLGQWLPNPMSSRVRREVAARVKPGTLLKGVSLGRGFDDLVPEMFGLQTGNGKRIYVSDGGHYDNLGLLALLRAKCAEIICVDSDADKDGESATLRQVIGLAETELGARIDLDIDSFKGSGGVLPNIHAVGEVHYEGGGTARLTVIKLGLRSDLAADFTPYQTRDPKFPYHGTVIQWYDAARFDAYRRLGRVNATQALSTASDKGGS